MRVTWLQGAGNSLTRRASPDGVLHLDAGHHRHGDASTNWKLERGLPCCL